MNIYPYNMYFFYAICLITLFYLMITFTKMVGFKDILKQTKSKMEPMRIRLLYLHIANEMIQQEILQKRKKENQLIKLLIPVTLSVILTYMRDRDLHGIKGYISAAKRVYRKKQNEHMLRRELSKLIIK